MNKTFNKFIVALLIASLFVFPMTGVNGGVQAQDSFPPALEPYLSADGLALYNAAPTLVIMVDPNPAMQGIKIPAPEIDKVLADPAAASAAFSFTYVAAGGTDPWGQVCTTFPENAKTAFNAAAAIWASTIHSSVLITIQACWASLSSPTTLGYSGGAPQHRDFPGAPKANTWYEGSLANSLSGSDLEPTMFDMNITYNSNFTWYYGTDSNPPDGQHDLVTVAAHEIAHGLNFSGLAQYSGGTGSYGYEGSPNIYDTFMEDNGGTKLTSYTTPSTELGTLLTSGSLWFNGTNANAANGGTRVKMYAPFPWKSGSSYAHLDEIFNGTVNDMMTFSVASGSANHNPGPVTTGLLKDLGWVLAGETTGSTIYLPLVLRAPASSPPGDFNKSAPANGATGQPANPSLSWGASSNATSYEYCIDTNSDNTCNTSWISTGTSTSVGLSGLTPATSYYWQVRANNALGTTYANSSTWWSLTTAASPIGPTPGYWQSSGDTTEFYVTPDRTTVRKFSILVNLPGCGTYWIYRGIPDGDAPISSNQFSFSGPFYASGTFNSSTAAHGTSGLSSFGPVCGGYWNGGPWAWSATWQDSSQPTFMSALTLGPGFVESAPGTESAYIAIPVK